MTNEIDNTPPQTNRRRYYPRLSDKDADTVFVFFIVFSRFEYALKQAGYHTLMKHDFVTPNWNKFVEEVEGDFARTNSEVLQRACQYYLKHPPKIQTLEDGQLTWRDDEFEEGKSDLARITHSIRTVRNNLFHGGKFPQIRKRDIDLLSNGVVILDALLDLNARLHHAFIRGT